MDPLSILINRLLTPSKQKGPVMDPVLHALLTILGLIGIIYVLRSFGKWMDDSERKHEEKIEKE